MDVPRAKLIRSILHHDCNGGGKRKASHRRLCATPAVPGALGTKKGTGRRARCRLNPLCRKANVTLYAPEHCQWSGQAQKLSSPSSLSSMTTHRKPPSYVFLSREAVKLYEEQTRKGVYNLLPSEVRWRDRQPELRRRGYQLRRRYQMDWKPSWIGTNKDPEFCEDSVFLMVSSGQLSVNSNSLTTSSECGSHGCKKRRWISCRDQESIG